VGIRDAGMVDLLLKIWGENVSDFEQAIGRAMTDRCQMCGRALDVPDDPLPEDCGGDRWGRIGLIEALGGYGPLVEMMAEEISAGVRDAEGRGR